MTRALAFFGAFNPPTVAHVALARYALEATGRERVVFVPSKSVYIRGEQHKDYAFDDAARLRMLRAIAKDRPWMRVTDCELRAAQQPRTYDTLCRLRRGGTDAALLMGADKLPELEHIWLHVDQIAREFGIVCLARGEGDCRKLIAEDAYLSRLAPYIQVIETPGETRNVSSTRVRELLAQIGALRGELSELVPDEIMKFL